MFEREIKFIYDFNLNKVNKLGPYFTFEQLQNSDLHPAILHYISAEIDYLVFEDRQKLLKNSVFDYSGEKITYYFSQITEELKKVKRFSLEYIAKLILHSTSFTVNYLVRPRWTLTRFIFDESKHKSSTEIKQILNYVYYYKYLKTIINSYLNSKKILSMNIEEFDELLSKTDKLSLESNFNGVISSSLLAMAEFFNIGQVQKTRIPLAAIELFLEEKNLPNHLQKITDVLGTDENANYHVSDYMRLINSVVIEKEIEEQLEPEFQFENKVEIIEQDKIFTNDDNNELKNEFTNNEEESSGYFSKDEIENNMTENFEEKNSDEIRAQNDFEYFDNEIIDEEKFEGISNEELDELRDEIEEDEKEIENKYLDDEENELSYIENPIEENEILINDEQTEQITEEGNLHSFENETKDEVNININNETSISKEDKKLDFNDIIENKDVSKIIETIFDYDFEDFTNALDEISKCKNYDDALFVLDEILSKRKINRNSKEAEYFKEIISEYFNQ